MLTVTTPDGAAVTTEYELLTSGGLLGATTQVTDQASKKRKSVTDSLGNLARVIEDPSSLAYETNYSYDLLGNLLTVAQVAGAVTQTRTFVYDFASRLTSAANPESGTISYGYDGNNNLTSKTDARSIETDYVYDGLNRVIKRTYTGPSTLPDAYSATSDVNYYYDGKGLSSAPDYSFGKLTDVANDASETRYAGFDISGRILKSEQITDGLDVCTGTSAACQLSYQYNLAGALTDETYPSGRIVHHNYAGDGKESAVSSRLAANRPFKSYAQNISYSAAGAVTATQLGNMRWESTSFNNRLQPTKIALGATAGGDDMLKLEYTYSTSANSYHDDNGNVLSQKITVDDVGTTAGFVATQTYTYDELNRLKSAIENSTPNGGSSSQSWKQTYLYDRFGNRTFDTSSGATTTLPTSFNAHIYNPTINPANNQFDTGQDYAYDSAGNVTQDAAGKKFAYDGENKQTSFGTGGSSTNGGTYVYDGDGKRVKKIVGTEVTIFVYNAASQMVAEYATTPPTSPHINYLTKDTLGTPRVNTDSAGAVIARHDYMPFGDELISVGIRGTEVGYGNDDIRQRFTRKERDMETGLDCFGARYYASLLGRFSSPDPITIAVDRLFDPQRLNRYSYVRNNPLIFTDPDGRDIVIGNGDQARAKKALVEIAKRPGGRELLKKLDKLSIQLIIGTGDSKGHDYGSIKAQDPTKNEFTRVHDSNGNVVDIKGDPIAINLDFKRLDADRKENDKRIENNRGMAAAGLAGKPLIPDVPTSDAELEGHELIHGDFQFFKNGNAEDEVAVTGRIDAILAAPVDKDLAADAKQFVDDLVKPNQAQPATPATQSTPEPQKKNDEE